MLPDEYQQVEYIESSGTQWIDTGIKTSINLTFGGKFSFDSNNMSHGYTSPQGRLIIGRHSGGYLYVSIGNISNFPVQSVADSEFHTFETSAYHLTYSFDGIDYRASNSYDEVDTEFTISIFARRENWGSGKLETFVRGKCCKAYLYDKDMLVRNYIPCYSTTTVTDINGKECLTGTIGLYDTVEGKFYTNQGTGEFIAGPDVNE